MHLHSLNVRLCSGAHAAQVPTRRAPRDLQQLEHTALAARHRPLLTAGRRRARRLEHRCCATTRRGRHASRRRAAALVALTQVGAVGRRAH